MKTPLHKDPVVLLGIDTGGTFTDFILLDGGTIRVHKRLTTPDDPAIALLEGVNVLSLPEQADVVHGSTIATNAILERRGARTAFISTIGFSDIVEIGRQNRPDLYALHPVKSVSLIPPELRFEVQERVTADGQILVPLEADSLQELIKQIEEFDIEAAAVCLLFSFLSPEHEQQIKSSLPDTIHVSLSSDILPEYREYERASTTVLNAYVAPLMSRYLKRVDEGLEKRNLRVMQSNGGVITAQTAGVEAARTVLSGPAGGAVGAFHIAQMAGIDQIISFDMGGTSTDVSLFPGEIIHTRESTIGGMALRLPVIDIHTVGAGGGSIARVDGGGALRVGPESAGADPGPVCYGKGENPTVSDANLVLGRLQADYFLGGEMALYPERARDSLTRLAEQMQTQNPEAAAWGIVQVANAAMGRAIRKISVERGYDPRQFTLVPFGGAGSLHACDLADSLRIPHILIPRTPGVLSALGMTIADLTRDYAFPLLKPIGALESNELNVIFSQLSEQGRRDLLTEGVDENDIRFEAALDMRYKGQSHEITINQPADRDWEEAFHINHQRLYGYIHRGQSVEVMTLRLRAIG